jgi:hypothetical protein
MKTLRTRFFMPLITLLMTLNMGPMSAQSKKPIPKKRPTKPATVSAEPKSDNPPAQQPAASAGGGVWVIRRNGKSLEFFQVVLYTSPGTLSTEVTVPRTKSAPPLNEMALNLLRLSNRLNYVKIGVDKDDLFVRNETRLKSLSVEEFNDNIERVATAADTVYREMQQFK